MCERWDSTVRTERYSWPAISAFVWPSAMRRRTSTSRSDRSSGWPARAGGAAASAAPGRGVGDLSRAGGGRVEVLPPGVRAPPGLDQLAGGRLLEDVAGGAGAQGLAGELGILL